MSGRYAKGNQKMLEGQISWSTQDFKAVLLTAAYTVDLGCRRVPGRPDRCAVHLTQPGQQNFDPRGGGLRRHRLRLSDRGSGHSDGGVQGHRQLVRPHR